MKTGRFLIRLIKPGTFYLCSKENNFQRLATRLKMNITCVHKEISMRTETKEKCQEMLKKKKSDICA
jgi:hypothetical protein